MHCGLKASINRSNETLKNLFLLRIKEDNKTTQKWNLQAFGTLDTFKPPKSLFLMPFVEDN